MAIIINAAQEIDNEKQWVFMTISEVNGHSIKYIHVAPLSLEGEKLQEFVNAKEDKYKLYILKDMYQESDYLRFYKVGKTELDAMKDWISAGHKNKIQAGLTASGKPKYGYEIIGKQDLQYKHPKSVRLLALIEASSVAKEIKDLLKEIVK